MKKYRYIITLAASVAVVSCSKESLPKENLPESPVKEQMTISANAPALIDEATKTYLVSNNITWAANDEINIFAGSANEKFTLESGAGTASGSFTGNAVSGDLYGLYPYDADATCTDGVITASLKAQQNASRNGIPNTTNLAIAHLEASGMTFANVCGIVRFDIKSDNVAEVVISGNSNEDLAGKVSISWNNGAPTYTVIEGSKTVSIKTYNGKVFERGTYYALVLPQTFTNGITVTLNPYKWDADEVLRRSNQPNPLVKTGSSALELQRSHIKPLGRIDQGLVWNYANTVICGGLRGSHKATGCYMDLSTGRTFSPIGSYIYSNQIELCFITNTSNGLAPAAMSTIGSFTNATNLDKFAESGTSSEADYMSNWPTARLAPKFAYVAASELSDEQYEAITTVAEIKAIYDAHSSAAVNTYYNTNCVTNANRTTTNKFLVIKTYSNLSGNSEGTGYGIMKFLAVGGATWYINFNYKHGLE